MDLTDKRRHQKAREGNRTKETQRAARKQRATGRLQKSTNRRKPVWSKTRTPNPAGKPTCVFQNPKIKCRLQGRQYLAQGRTDFGKHARPHEGLVAVLGHGTPGFSKTRRWEREKTLKKNAMRMENAGQKCLFLDQGKIRRKMVTTFPRRFARNQDE